MKKTPSCLEGVNVGLFFINRCVFYERIAVSNSFTNILAVSFSNSNSTLLSFDVIINACPVDPYEAPIIVFKKYETINTLPS
ncbi:MAG: hypothetical protein K0S34_285 [Bacillales bacterium]|jgi:hypothetical protein|nr:hypothetical protein [Bacillales bacterium]